MLLNLVFLLFSSHVIHCCWYCNKRCPTFICLMTPCSVLEELEKNHINSPLAFLNIAAVTGGLKMHCTQKEHILKCVKYFFPSDQYFEICYTYYGAQIALAIKPSSLPWGYPLNREVSFGYNFWFVCISDFSSSWKGENSFFWRFYGPSSPGRRSMADFHAEL